MFWLLICAIALADANYVPMERVGPSEPVKVGDAVSFRVEALSSLNQEVIFKPLAEDGKKQKTFSALGWMLEREGDRVLLYPLKPGMQVSPEIGVIDQDKKLLFVLSPVSVEVLAPEGVEEQRLSTQLKKISYPWELKAVLAVLILLVVFALLWGMVRWSRRFRKKESSAGTAPRTKDADIRILKRIQEIREKRTWEKDGFRLVFLDLSQTFKEFLEERYSVSALDLTSFEILEVLRSKIVSLDDLDSLRELLNEMDFIKFSNSKVTEDFGLSVLSKLESWVQKKRRSPSAIS